MPQVGFENRSGFRVVFQDHDWSAMEIRRGSHHDSVGRRRFSLVNHGNLGVERRSNSDFAFQPKAVPQQHREVTTEWQSQSRPPMPFLKRVFYLAELLEYCFVIFGWDAYAGVLHHENDAPFGRTPDRHRDLALGSELQGVGNQVPENLRNLTFIGVKSWNAAAVLENEVNGSIVGQKRLEHAF